MLLGALAAAWSRSAAANALGRRGAAASLPAHAGVPPLAGVLPPAAVLLTASRRCGCLFCAAAGEGAAAADGDGEPALPALPDRVEARPGGARTIDVGGEALTLDELGPIVIQADGRMGRLSNWQEMTALEQEQTLKFVAKRNKQRRSALLKRQSELGEAGE